MKYILLSLFFLLLSCTTQKKQGIPSLVDTKWEYLVYEDCISYITFKSDSTYEDYNCERDYPFSGKYEVKKDTIYLIEIDLASELPGETRKVVIGRSKYLFKEESLKYISWEDFKNDKWSNIIFPTSDIFYKKAKEKVP